MFWRQLEESCGQGSRPIIVILCTFVILLLHEFSFPSLASAVSNRSPTPPSGEWQNLLLNRNQARVFSPLKLNLRANSFQLRNMAAALDPATGPSSLASTSTNHTTSTFRAGPLTKREFEAIVCLFTLSPSHLTIDLDSDASQGAQITFLQLSRHVSELSAHATNECERSHADFSF